MSQTAISIQRAINDTRDAINADDASGALKNLQTVGRLVDVLDAARGDSAAQAQHANAKLDELKSAYEAVKKKDQL